MRWCRTTRFNWNFPFIPINSILLGDFLVLHIVYRAILQGGFEFIEELRHAAWDCQCQNFEAFFQRIV